MYIETYLDVLVQIISLYLNKWFTLIPSHRIVNPIHPLFNLRVVTRGDQKFTFNL